jgi:hypothetical protein
MAKHRFKHRAAEYGEIEHCVKLTRSPSGRASWREIWLFTLAVRRRDTHKARCNASTSARDVCPRGLAVPSIRATDSPERANDLPIDAGSF